MKIPAVAHVLRLCGPPIRPLVSEATLVIAMKPMGQRRETRAEVAAQIRELLNKDIKEAAFWLRDSGRPPLAEYPLHYGVTAPEGDIAADKAEQLLANLKASPLLTDVHLSQASRPVPQVYVDVDRTKIVAQGINPSDVMAVIQTATGSVYVNDLAATGRRWQVQITGGRSSKVEDLLNLKIRNERGQMMPLSAVASVRDIKQPVYFERLNGVPMVPLRANPAPGVSIAAARRQIEAAAAGLTSCRVEWLGK